jgi:hypothetical protein
MRNLLIPVLGLALGCVFAGPNFVNRQCGHLRQSGYPRHNAYHEAEERGLPTMARLAMRPRHILASPHGRPTSTRRPIDSARVEARV